MSKEIKTGMIKYNLDEAAECLSHLSKNVDMAFYWSTRPGGDNNTITNIDAATEHYLNARVYLDEIYDGLMSEREKVIERGQPTLFEHQATVAPEIDPQGRG